MRTNNRTNITKLTGPTTMHIHLTRDKQYKCVSINEKPGDDSCTLNSRNVYSKHTSDNGQYLT